MNVMVFDIETIPDTQAGALLHNFENLNEIELADAMFTLRRQESGGSDFLRHYCHRIVAISIVFRHRDEVSCWSLGDVESSEKELLTRFFQGLDRYSPTLVSWNGSGFDLPVIHYRSLIHKVSAPRYWETGDSDQSFRWNNYLSRFHHRHCDLMDILAGYQARANAPLNDVATLLGLPGKFSMSGGNVWEQYKAGKLDDIRHYCETDVLNTYLIYLRYELMRGNLTEATYQQECDLLRNYLGQQDKSHLQKFNELWQ